MFLHADIVVTSHHDSFPRTFFPSERKNSREKARRRRCKTLPATTLTDAICCDYECLLAIFLTNGRVVAISCLWLAWICNLHEKTLKFSQPTHPHFSCFLKLEPFVRYDLVSSWHCCSTFAHQPRQEMETSFGARKTNPMNNDSFE